MAKRLFIGDSIYQRRGSAPGLTVNAGMLINNRPNSVSGIAQAASLRRQMKREEKIEMIAEAIVRGEQRSDIIEVFGKM
jgi:hypothetical protein